jgi:hypothetical protein
VSSETWSSAVRSAARTEREWNIADCLGGGGHRSRFDVTLTAPFGSKNPEACDPFVLLDPFFISANVVWPGASKSIDMNLVLGVNRNQFRRVSASAGAVGPVVPTISEHAVGNTRAPMDVQVKHALDVLRSSRPPLILSRTPE